MEISGKISTTGLGKGDQFDAAPRDKYKLKTNGVSLQSVREETFKEIESETTSLLPKNTIIGTFEQFQNKCEIEIHPEYHS